MRKSNRLSTDTLIKLFIYVALITLAISIIVPVAWVFLASIKQNKEFYGSPWSLPEGIHFQNFIEAFREAQMGEYLFNSMMVTALALIILLVVALPAAYVLSRFNFKGNRLLNSIVKAGLFINVSYVAVPIF
jgi:N-acetylglucosamine transport system permease protein